MGMASSQARLLTLTSRLHSIELKAQKIEAEKLRLANDSDAVYNTYLDKLEQTKLVANILSGDGSMTSIDLTAKVIYDYKTLREQYSLITKDNKALIPQSVSNNYRNTNSLSEFLSAYGLDSGFTQTIHHEDPNPAYVNQEDRYQRDLEAWNTYYQGWLQRRDETEAQHEQWERDKINYDYNYNNFLRDHEKWLNEDKPTYTTKHAEWVTENPANVKNDTEQPWWVDTAYDMATDFNEATKNCFENAHRGTTSCYRHVMQGIIDFDGTQTGADTAKNYTTSLGQSGTTCGGLVGINSNVTLSSGKKRYDVLKLISTQLNTGIKPKADGESPDITESSTDYQKLVSKWKINPDGSKELKTLKQWACDLDYIAANYRDVTGYEADDFKNSIERYQNSLSGSLKSIDETIYQRYVTEWEAKEPHLRPEPTWNGELGPEPVFTEALNPRPNRDDYVTEPPTLPRDEVINHTTFNDKNKAQWYINLWYKMEGQNETAKVMETVVHDDASNCDLYVYSCDNIPKSTTTYSNNADWNVLENENYMIIPDDKLNDPTWLRNAVVEGYVLIQEFDTSANAFKDTSVSTTTRIDEIPDEKGLKKAEAEYEADMNKINKKDRLYDVQLAKLEPERNAIKEELDSLKTVAKENVDRTFKLFS